MAIMVMTAMLSMAAGMAGPLAQGLLLVMWWELYWTAAAKPSAITSRWLLLRVVVWGLGMWSRVWSSLSQHDNVAVGSNRWRWFSWRYSGVYNGMCGC